MKKGTSHVDWAISMSIFLMYTLFVLLFLKPGIEPIYNEDNLISIVENGFINHTTYQVSITPIFLGATGAFVGENDYKIRIKYNFPFSGSSDNFAVMDRDMTIIKSKMLDSVQELEFDAHLTSADSVFWLLFSKDVSYQNENPANALEATYGVLEDPDELTFNLGVSNDVKGMSAEKINGINVRDYNALKREWGYPLEREFTISIIRSTSILYTQGNERLLNYAKAEPDIDAKVRSVDSINWLLNERGERERVIVNIKVW
jgi:hypothetical protein